MLYRMMPEAHETASEYCVSKVSRTMGSLVKGKSAADWPTWLFLYNVQELPHDRQRRAGPVREVQLMMCEAMGCEAPAVICLQPQQRISLHCPSKHIINYLCHMAANRAPCDESHLLVQSHNGGDVPGPEGLSVVFRAPLAIEALPQRYGACWPGESQQLSCMPLPSVMSGRTTLAPGVDGGMRICFGVISSQ